MAAMLRRVSCPPSLSRVFVERGQHDVETLEDGVLEIETAVGQDVDLDAVEDRHSGKAIPQGVDLLALAGDVAARERPRRGRARRVVCDRDVLVPERMTASDHRREVVAAIAVGRVHVQVAADVRRIDELRKIARRRSVGLATAVPELGRDERQPEARVECLLACVQALAPAPPFHLSQVGIRAGGLEESGAVLLRCRDEDLDRCVSERADNLVPARCADGREDASGRQDFNRGRGVIGRSHEHD